MRAPSVCVAEAPAAHPGDGFSGAPDLEPGLLLPATPHSRLPQEAPLPQTRLLTSLSLPPAGAGFTEKPKNEEVNKLPDSNHTRLSAGGGAAARAEGRPLGRVHPPGVPGAQVLLPTRPPCEPPPDTQRPSRSRSDPIRTLLCLLGLIVSVTPLQLPFLRKRELGDPGIRTLRMEYLGAIEERNDTSERGKHARTLFWVHSLVFLCFAFSGMSSKKKQEAGFVS